MNKGWFALGSVTLVGVLEILREISTFRVRRYQVQNPAFAKNPMRLVFLSDLHGKSYGKENGKLFKAIRNEKPDYILVGGDMLIRSEPDSMKKILNFMEKLTGICPVYCANGNHEQLMKDRPGKYDGIYADYKEKLEGYGIHMLENASEDLVHNGVPVTITGIEIPLTCYGHLREVPLAVSDIEACAKRPDRTRFQILLAHNPVYMKQYWKWGADLTLSGHLHGGVVRIPGIGGVITPQVRLFPKYSGDLYQEGGHCGIVSRGLGTHTVNVRLFNTAELVSVLLEYPS